MSSNWKKKLSKKDVLSIRANNSEVRVDALLTRIAELETFVQKVLDNFEPCEFCNGNGFDPKTEEECNYCTNGKHIVSTGVLYVEIPAEAASLLAEAK